MFPSRSQKCSTSLWIRSVKNHVSLFKENPHQTIQYILALTNLRFLRQNGGQSKLGLQYLSQFTLKNHHLLQTRPKMFKNNLSFLSLLILIFTLIQYLLNFDSVYLKKNQIRTKKTQIYRKHDQWQYGFK